LAENILKNRQNVELISVKYFTARIKADPLKQQRQLDYLDALETLPKLKIYYGNYKIKTTKDKATGTVYSYPVEKRTDVNIVTQLLLDAFNNNFDIAYVVSGDSDLLPAFEAIKNNFSHLTIGACFPPRRSLIEIKAVCHFTISLKEKLFKNSLLPDPVINNGITIHKPTDWS
jgi:uncharacterized LabA/DUF88 family protein